MTRMGAQHRSGGGIGALIPAARRTRAEIEDVRAKRLVRRTLLPSPRSMRATHILKESFLPDTEEVAFLRRASTTEWLAGGTGVYAAELRSIAEKAYRAAYAAQQKERRS